MPLPWKRHTPSQSEAEEINRSHTEKIAYELSQTRQLLKRPGDQTTDWETAEKIVKSPVRKVLYRCHRPLIRLEKNTWEPLLTWANNQALLSLLGLVGNIGLIIAVATYIGSEKQRRNAEVLNAWQTITSAHGQAGSGGRIQALEFLNASPGANWRRKFPWVCGSLSFCLWEAESLAGISLSVEGSTNSVENSQPYYEQGLGVYLQGIQLPKADLALANLQEVTLRYANLEGADLEGANLEKADLLLANMAEVSLIYANLQDGYLSEIRLSGANLRGANLKGVTLRYANLEGADLKRANLEKADLRWANLKGVTLKNADLGATNLEEAKNLTVEQLSQAKLCNTQLPENIGLSSDRDCAELGIPTNP